MTDANTNEKRQRRQDMLDALLDALEERRVERTADRTSASVRPAQAQPKQPPAAAQTVTKPEPKTDAATLKPGESGWTPPPTLPSIGLERALGRMLILVLALTIVLNIPVTRHGVSLARILPDSSALVIRDGLILKGFGPEIYRLEDDKLRWITSMVAFEHLGLAWTDVHEVDDAFLARFERGAPLHVLLKCSDSPHVYRLEGETKRWIKDIPTFEAEGHHWEDVELVPCDYLRGIPDGQPIPVDAGMPPQP